MSFIESAKEFALMKAGEIEEKAHAFAVFRSVDATEASRWLRSIADAIRQACGDEPTPRRKRKAKQ